MSDYDDYERTAEFNRESDRQEEFNREMDRDYENFQEDLKIEHEQAEETSNLAKSLIESGDAKAAAALYGYNITAPGAGTPAAGDSPLPSDPAGVEPYNVRERWSNAVALANMERQGLIDSTGARADWDYFTRTAIITMLQSLDLTSPEDCDKWEKFVGGLVTQSGIWLELQPFTQAVNKVRSARAWADIADIGGS